MVIQILICLVLLIIVIQDFKYRAVHWIMFPVLWILLVIDSVTGLKLRDYISGTAINLLIILIQVVILYTYYLFQGKNLKLTESRIIGAGDVLFIIIMAFAFTWTSFMFYYIAGLLFALILWLIITKIVREKTGLVPLAGLLALYMIMIILAGIVFHDCDRSLDIVNRYFVYGS